MSAQNTRIARNNLALALIALGGVTMFFAAFALGVVSLQEWMLGRVPHSVVRAQAAPHFPSFAEFVSAQRAMSTVWRTHFPFWFLGGLGFVVSGVRLRADERGGVQFARNLSVLALLAIFLYAIDCWLRAMPPMVALLAQHPFVERAQVETFAVFSLVSSVTVMSAPVFVLLWGMSKKEHSGAI